MQYWVNNFFVDIMQYINVLFANELIIYLVALMIVAGLIGLFSRLLKIRC